MVIDKLIAVVRNIAYERPDTTYGKSIEFKDCPGLCMYNKGECSDGTIGCIFGQALAAIGPYYPPTDLQNMGISDVLDHYGIDYADDQLDWCEKVQEGQDKGRAWEAAVAEADEMLQDRYNIRELA